MNRRKYITLAGVTLGVSVAGCLGGSGSTDGEGGSTDESNTDATESATSIVVQFYEALDNDPDPDRIDQFFHSQSPTAESYRGIFANRGPEDGKDITGLDPRVINENPTDGELNDRMGRWTDDQMVEEIIDAVNASPESAIVEIDIEYDEYPTDTAIWVVATEDGDWQLVW